MTGTRYCSEAFCKTRALATILSPGLTPESTSCKLGGTIFPPITSTRRNLLPLAGKYTQSRSCKCRTAERGREDSDDRRGMVHIGAQHLQAFERGFHVHVGFLGRVLGDFQILLRDRALFVQNFGALKLRAGQSLVGVGVPVLGKRGRQV